MIEYITTAEAAQRLGVTCRRVVALIAAGRLKAKRFGRDLLIDPRDLASVAVRPPGRPRKQSS